MSVYLVVLNTVPPGQFQPLHEPTVYYTNSSVPDDYFEALASSRAESLPSPRSGLIEICKQGLACFLINVLEEPPKGRSTIGLDKSFTGPEVPTNLNLNPKRIASNTTA